MGTLRRASFALVACVLVVYSSAESQSENGYVDKMCVTTGDTLRFFISTSLSRFSLSIYKCGKQKALLDVYDDLKGGIQQIPESSYVNGCGWVQTFSLKIPRTWTPGVYLAEFPITKGKQQIVFVVQSEKPGSYSKICIKLTVNTWQAYNTFGGRSLYDNKVTNVKASPRVSFNRPYNAAYGNGPYFRWEDELVTWLDSQGIPFEVTTDAELYKNPTVLEPYRLVIIAGHDEYWSRPERDQIDQFVTRGGRLMILSGNTCWWQVRFEDDARTIVCYKDQSTDPYTGKIDSLVTVNWRNAPINNPENSLTGLSYGNGGYVNSSGIRPRSLGYGGYAVFGAHHWIYDGTSLEDGQCFGYSSSIVGYEVDGNSFRWINGIPTVTGIDKTPLNFKILGLSPSTGGDGSMKNHALMGMYTRSGGGAVFNVGTTNWVDGLAVNRSVQKITKNVLVRFLSGRFPPSIISWSPYRIQTDSILHESISYNSRALTIPPGTAQLFSVRATDPEGKPLGYYWTVNGEVVARDSSFEYQPEFGQSLVDTIIARVYNEYDTASIRWCISKTALKIAPVQTVFDVESGSSFYQKLDVQHYFADPLTYQIAQGPAWLNVTPEGEATGIPVDTEKCDVKVSVSDRRGNQDSISFCIKVHHYLVVDNFEYDDTPFNHGWVAQTPTVEGTITTEFDSSLQTKVMNIVSTSGMDFRIQRDLNFSRSHFSMKLLATSPFNLTVYCTDSAGIFLQAQYLPDEGANSLSGNYFFFRIGTAYRNGKWHALERDCAADISGLRRTVGLKVLGYSIGGALRADDVISYPFPLVPAFVEPSVTPSVFELIQNFPNPFNPSTQLSYALPSEGIVRLQIFDILGRLVKTLVPNERQEAGNHSIRWEGVDSRGRDVSSGVYFQRLELRASSSAGATTATRKMILLR